MTSHISVKGGIYNDSGTWVVRARVLDPYTGNVKQRSKSTGLKVNGNNKRRAEEKMREILANWEREANTGIVQDFDSQFGDCVRLWLEEKALTLRPNTLHSYEVNATAHIIPRLGKIRICDLTRQHIQHYFEELNGKLSPTTMKKHRVIIRGVLETAVLDGTIQQNVADHVRLPQGKKFEGRTLAEAEVADILAAASAEPIEIETALVLALAYALRRSEICGLRWCDIDFERNILHIRNTITDYSGLKIEAEHTKTRASRRDLCMIDATIPFLKNLREQQQKSGIKTDKVCCRKNGDAVKPEYLTRAIEQTLKKYGHEGVRLHDLRHTAASMLARRLPVKQVQAFLGHEDVSTTLNIYTHLTDEDKVSTSRTMSGILEKSISCSEKCSDFPKTARSRA